MEGKQVFSIMTTPFKHRCAVLSVGFKGGEMQQRLNHVSRREIEKMGLNCRKGRLEVLIQEMTRHPLRKLRFTHKSYSLYLM